MKRLLSLCFLFAFVSLNAASSQLTTFSLSAGANNAFALRSDGSLWAFGTNCFGELGLGTNAYSLAPKRIAGLTNIAAVSAGPQHSLAVSSNGTVWAWGTNGSGRLGNGTSISTNNPTAVSLITNAIAVAAGGNHSLAALADGRVVAWGTNNVGQLGTGNLQSTNKPVQVDSFTNVIAVAAGTNFSLALTRSGEVWSWGTNNSGQLGLGDNTSRSAPVKLNALSNIVQIAAGHNHALARDTNGNVFAWGRNTEGQIGIGNTVNTNSPTKLASFGPTNALGPVKWIAANFNSSTAINTNGRLHYWGWYNNAQDATSTNQPTILGSMIGQAFSTVTYGDSFLLAGKDDGSVWAWGASQSGQWGNGIIMDDWFYFEVYNPGFSFSAQPVSEMTRFNRGTRLASKLPYNSFVLPSDLERGVRLPAEGSDLYSYGTSTPWFLKIQKTSKQHALVRSGSTTNLIRFREDNPIVAFGSEGGGSPLYTGQRYSFGAYGGAFDEKAGQTNMLRISVFDRSALSGNVSNVPPTNVFTISLPRRFITSDSNAWSNFITNGSRVVIETNGLRTVVEFAEGLDANTGWGLLWQFGNPTSVYPGGYRITHTALSTNYCYLVEGLGSVEVGANVMSPMSTNSTGWAYSSLYTIDFESFPAWRSRLIDQPHFEGTPLPPTYAGRRLEELNGITAVITNKIWVTNNTEYSNLDSTPELRRHPILDQFVEDMGRDPLALASYVLNEIELAEPMGLIDSPKMVERSVEIGGVNRSALGVFLEGQGSPAEQCALLVYLLRQAGFSAGYVFPTNGNLKLLDTRLSQLWQIQVKGVVYDYGAPIITNSLITVNYPWVVANIGTNSVQIFPWLKDSEIVEGLDIYDFTPTNHATAYDWIKDFALAKPELTALGSLNDGAATIWKRYLVNVINTNTIQSNLSLDDFGVRAFNRKNSYANWDRLPVPNVLTNQTKVAVVPTLTESAVTYPFLTNMFDRVRVEVFKTDTNTANRIFDTDFWRACDFHNRKLLLYTNTPGNLRLWLSSFRPSLTAFTNFSNFETSTNSMLGQVLNVSVAGTVSNLPVRVTYKRRGWTLASPDTWFSMVYATPDPQEPMVCKKRDVTAIIPSVSRVTAAMLRVHADDYWRQQQLRALDPNYTPGDTNDVGTAMMLLASGFFQKVWDDDQFNQRLHKIRAIRWNSSGVVGAARLANNRMQLTLNMKWLTEQTLGNASLHPDSGDNGFYALNNYLAMIQANGSSAEHSIINSMWGDNNSISSIRLLQLAAERARSNSWAEPLELNIKNYIGLGNKSYTGYGATLLKNQNPPFWQKITNVFWGQWDSNYYRALITPGPVASDTGDFQGMSALVFGKWNSGAIVSDNDIILNGGVSAKLSWAGSPSAGSSYDLSYNLIYGPSLGYDFYSPFGFGLNYPVVYTYTYRFIPNNRVTYEPRLDFSQYDLLNLNSSSNIAKTAFTPQQVTQGSVITSALNLGGGTTTPVAIKTAKNVGWLGQPNAGIQQPRSFISDPVHVVTGDFYVNSSDLVLAGPMPLELRRNYLSRNLADNQFGHGWKSSLMPWLVRVTNSLSQKLIYAAEMDGAILVYRYQSNNLWTVQADDNPALANYTSAGIGSTANQFNNRIEEYTTNGTLYVLSASDGSKKFYQVLSSFGLSNGTNDLPRVRPYLTRWEDHVGNYFLFSYGTNSTANDYGQLARVAGANGATLVFKYDVFGRVVEGMTDDNRHLYYTYDNYGDLVAVKLPDESTWLYEYEHYTFSTNGLNYTDSNHLLVREVKPDGRLLANVYDSLRRVTIQAASVGSNRELVTNAWIYYTNNVTSLTNEFITGTTRVEDVFHNAYVYGYTNGLITRIDEPAGRSFVQDWFESSETNKSGYYPRSLELVVDVRGLTTEFQYDTRGNIVTRITRGDLTGDAVTNQTATSIVTYANDMPATITNPTGNRAAYFYDSVDPYLLIRTERSNGGSGIVTNRFSYTNVTETVSMGPWSKTNSAFGLLARVVQADSATNEWTYNGRGFAVQSVQYAKTADYLTNADPPVINLFSFTSRGDLTERQDTLGRKTRMAYDAMGRLQWREVNDESNNTLARESFYYNRNGELEWYDGPRSNPEDLLWFNYDGAGRKTEEIRWRSRAKLDGTGVEAETGDALYATTFHRYDAFGNLISTTDPNQAVTTNTFDALGRLTIQKVLEANGTLLTSQGFAYELGGQISFHTNALGGVTEQRYTSTGQLKYRRNPDGSTNGWRYYLDGRVSTNFVSNGAYSRAMYDDANRTTTRLFYSPAGVPLATNTLIVDGRGNPIRWIDEAGNSFTNIFDGLNRLKASFGPSISQEAAADLPNPGGPPPPIQQATTNFYDAVGVVFTNVNAIGEKQLAYFDALGRPTRTEIRSANNTIVRETSVAYSADHNSTTVTSGSGANAIISTAFSGTDGQPLLSIGYPQPSVREFTRWEYDAVGNLAFEGRYSSSNGNVAVWSQAYHSYDGLNRLRATLDRDNALTTFDFDGLGNLTNRVLPGGLTWQAEFNAAGQLLKSFNLAAGNTGTRTNTYTYYTSGAFVGLPQTSTDGRGVTCTHGYDAYLRPATKAYSGSLGEHGQTTTWQYDARGLVTNITEGFANSSYGPNTTIKRSYDPYGLLKNETVLTNGALHSAGTHAWNSAGRRTSLGFGSFGYSFGWNADGRLGGAAAGAAGAGYTYTTAGLLASRTVSALTVNVASRDGMGRMLARNSVFNGTNVLQETFTWTGDGLTSTHTLVRPDFTDTRSYDYTAYSRRLAVERLQISGSKGWTNIFQYDEGDAGGAGVLTKVAEPQTGGSSWSASLDPFNRIERETNNVIRRLANGRMNASNMMASITVRFDGRPLPLHWLGDGDASWPTRWQAMMELRPGAHTLEAEARHSSGLFTTNRTSTFTNNAIDQTTLSHFAEGQLSYRVWKNSLGETNRVQTFSWDGRSRLIATTELDASNNGYTWTAVYDAFGRRLLTKTIIVTNGVALTGQPKVINSFFDPAAEFLEVGVKIEGMPAWKLYGPDSTGSYGDLNGTGGFEGTVDDVGVFHASLSDARGNVLAQNDPVAGSLVWTASRPSGYGAVPEYRPVALVHNHEVAAASAWRGRWPDLSGLYWLGARYYDPVAGRFISCDPLGHDADPSLYGFASGDPINFFDPDGRFGRPGSNLVLDENLIPIGGFSDYDAFYLGRGQAMTQSIMHDPAYRSYMPITDWPGPDGRSFRMMFGEEAAAFGEAAVMLTTGPIGTLHEVAESSKAAGEASVTGRDRGFAYTRAAVSFGMGAVTLYGPVRGTVGNTYSTFGRFSAIGEGMSVGGGRGMQIRVNSRGGEFGGVNFNGLNAPRTMPKQIGRVEPPNEFKPGTTSFGNAMHERITEWLRQKYPDVTFRFNIKPGQTGVDIETMGSGNQATGFRFGEIKPLNPRQEIRFGNQAENWGFQPGEVKPFTYDANGNIYEGF